MNADAILYYPNKPVVKINHQTVLLTPHEHTIMMLLIAQSAHGVTKEMLFDAINVDASDTPHKVKQLISSLRKKLSTHSDNEFIKTKGREGYQWTGKAQRIRWYQQHPRRVLLKAGMILTLLFGVTVLIQYQESSSNSTPERSQYLFFERLTIHPELSFSEQSVAYWSGPHSSTNSELRIDSTQDPNSVKTINHVADYEWHPSSPILAVLQHSRYLQNCSVGFYHETQQQLIRSIACPSIVTSDMLKTAHLMWTTYNDSILMAVKHATSGIITFTYLPKKQRWAKQMHTIKFETDEISSVSVPPNKPLLILRSADKTTQLYQMNRNQDDMTLAPIKTSFKSYDVTVGKVHNTDKLLYVSLDRKLRTVDIQLNTDNLDDSFISTSDFVTNTPSGTIWVTSHTEYGWFFKIRPVKMQNTVAGTQQLTLFHASHDGAVMVTNDRDGSQLNRLIASSDNNTEQLPYLPLALPPSLTNNQSELTWIDISENSAQLLSSTDGIYLNHQKIRDDGAFAQFLGNSHIIYLASNSAKTSSLRMATVHQLSNESIISSTAAFPRVSGDLVCYLELLPKYVTCLDPIHDVAVQSASFPNINQWTDYYLKEQKLSVIIATGIADTFERIDYHFETGEQLNAQIIYSPNINLNAEFPKLFQSLPIKTSHIVIYDSSKRPRFLDTNVTVGSQGNLE